MGGDRLFGIEASDERDMGFSNFREEMVAICMGAEEKKSHVMTSALQRNSLKTKHSMMRSLCNSKNMDVIHI